jgi:hypothetical protein
VSTKRRLTKDELQYMIVRLNYGSNEIFDSMCVVENKDRFLWNKINTISNEIEIVVNQLRELKKIVKYD